MRARRQERRRKVRFQVLTRGSAAVRQYCRGHSNLRRPTLTGKVSRITRQAKTSVAVSRNLIAIAHLHSRRRLVRTLRRLHRSSATQTPTYGAQPASADPTTMHFIKSYNIHARMLRNFIKRVKHHSSYVLCYTNCANQMLPSVTSLVFCEDTRLWRQRVMRRK